MRKLTALLLILLGTPVLAGDKCFYAPTLQPYQSYSVPYAYDYEVEKVNVVTNQLSISPVKTPQKDILGEMAFQKVWKELTDAIPIAPAPQTLRKFQFVRNWPTVPAQQRVQRQQQQVQLATTTQVLQGVVRQSIVVEGGVTVVQGGTVVFPVR